MCWFQLDNTPPIAHAFSLNTMPLQLLLRVTVLTSSSLVPHFPVHFLTTTVQILVVTMQVGINTVSVTYGMF
jgi:hypothetical protein